MLVLTRCINETLVIGDLGEVKITILDVKGLRVRLGIKAPRQISVNREEIFQKMRAQNDEDNG